MKIFLLLFLFILSTSGYQFIYKNGRPKDGFLGFSESYETPENRINQENSHITIDWITQKLDHFNTSDVRTWKQMYWVNDAFYKPGGPAFILLGGEGPTSRAWIDTTNDTKTWMALASSFNALCFQLEHRYYGSSWPTPDMSTENMQYLSSRQALDDAVAFINVMNSRYNLPSDQKWVSFGGSYSGALSGWLKEKYPDVVVGAIASSGPVQAVVDFKEFLGVVRDSVQSYSTECLTQIEKATAMVEQLIRSENGRQVLQMGFKLCDPIDINNSDDVSNFFVTLAGNIMGIVQYSNDNRGDSATILTIENLCQIMTDTRYTTALERYSLINGLVMESAGVSCFDFKYQKMIDTLRQTNWKNNNCSATRSWIYQTCTEFGYYQTSDLQNQPFGHKFPLRFIIKQCADIFGPEFTAERVAKGVNSTNAFYGAKSGFNAENVVLPNGSIDPWHWLGITKGPVDPSDQIIYINGTAHCADMYAERDSDLPELKLAREIIRARIQLWLI